MKAKLGEACQNSVEQGAVFSKLETSEVPKTLEVFLQEDSLFRFSYLDLLPNCKEINPPAPA